ncbi:MAG: molybdopterin-binding/glycosyltransferase family 2 protein [Rhizobiaceae bacterium]
MKFGPVAIKDAEGALLAHAVTIGSKRLRKAHRLSVDDVSALRAAGISEVIAARLDDDDLDENEAAARIVRAIGFEGIECKEPSTGRVNLHALAAGVFTVDAALIDRINLIDPAVTIATLNNYCAVEGGQMVATVKIIPFAVSKSIVAQVEDACRGSEIFSVSAFRPKRVSIIQTELPTLKPSVLDKTVRVTQDRLSRSGSRVVAERRTAHSAEAVAGQITPLLQDSDMVLVFGASAMSDFDDVIPAAIRLAGGTVVRAGMPVDPGNLIVLGTIGGKHVIGAPGCARSPKENGFDWVLDRLLAGIEVGDRDIAAMGVGGLLMEIASRPQPREASPGSRRPNVEIVLLAAGRSSRMGGPNKLLALFDGVPLVRHVAERCVASRAAGVIAVTGHQSARVDTALSGLDLRIVENAEFATGLASSLKVGIASVSEGMAGAMIVLGDMPGVLSSDLDRLISAFVADGGHSIVRATFEGRRGNPVILPRSLFPEVARLKGDTGARAIVEAEGASVIDVEIGEAAFVDVDTPDAMAGAGGVLQD